MTFVQVLTPNTGVRCWPGDCLRFVSDAFQITASDPNTKNQVSLIPHTNYGTATAAWNASKQHQDQNFPAGCYVPVWFSLRDEPAGHVAIMCPDGSVYSSSSPYSLVAYHHPSLAALINYYALANPLTYLGWSEDIGGTAVITQGGDMPDRVNLDTARILAFQCLARDGEDGRPNAHKGECDDDLNKNHVGQPLTNQYIRDNFFSSTEASNAFGIKNAVYAARNSAQATVATDQQTISSLQKQLTDAQAALKAEQDKSAGLAKNLNDSQLARDDANKQLDQAESLATDDDAKIKDLTAKLSAAQAQIDQLKAGAADKPPANLTNTSTPTPQKDSTHQNLLSNLLDALVSFIKGAK